MEALVLAFSHSKLKDVVGGDALRMVLAGQYRDMVSGNTMNLQVVWDLLHDQPNFNVEDAKPPFCAMKSWEKELRVSAQLPSQLADLGPTEILALASHCAVPKKLRQLAFDREGEMRKARDRAQRATEASATTPQVSTRKPAWEAGLALVAVLTLGFAIYSAVGFMSGGGYQKVTTEEIGSLLPIKSAKRLGADMTIHLSNDGWQSQPEDQRTEVLKEALTRLGASKVEVLVVRDSTGQMVGSAQWTGTPPHIQVRLR